MFPIAGGIVPASLLPARFNILRDWNLHISSGMVPVKPFVWLDMSSSRRMKVDSEKSDIFPERALDDTSNLRNSGRLFNHSGRVPERELDDMLS